MKTSPKSSKRYADGTTLEERVWKYLTSEEGFRGSFLPREEFRDAIKRYFKHEQRRRLLESAPDSGLPF